MTACDQCGFTHTEGMACPTIEERIPVGGGGTGFVDGKCDHDYGKDKWEPFEGKDLTCLKCGYIHECRHGSLKRKCEICQRDEELESLRSRLALYQKLEEAAKELSKTWVDEKAWDCSARPGHVALMASVHDLNEALAEIDKRKEPKDEA